MMIQKFFSSHFYGKLLQKRIFQLFHGDVRCAAFMGYSIIAQSSGTSIKEINEAKAAHDFSRLPFQGFLCNITVKQLEDSFLQQLPIEMRGKEFLDHHEVSIDHVTTIDPKKNYQVRQCASHPVYEHDRVHRFKEYLLALNFYHAHQLVNKQCFRFHHL
jgi:hypothetical protein